MLYRSVTPDNVSHSGPKLDVSSVQWVHVVDFWDGPLEGSILVEGHRYWAIHVDENKWLDDDAGGPQPWYRRYVVLDLTSEEWAEQDRWDDLFRRHVGTHWDYVDGQRQAYEATRPKDEWHLFYDEYSKRVRPGYSDHEIAWWFES